MKTTYYRTMLNPDLTKATIMLATYKGVKYEARDEEPEITKFTGVTSWTVVEGGEEAKQCEKFVAKKDENDEYLILTYANGKTEIYCNSHVAMFVL